MEQSPLERLTHCLERDKNPELVGYVKFLKVIEDEVLFSTFVQNMKAISDLFDADLLPCKWDEVWQIIEAISSSVLVDLETESHNFKTIDSRANNFKGNNWLYVAMCYPVPQKVHEPIIPKMSFHLIQACCLMDYFSLVKMEGGELSDNSFDESFSIQIFIDSCMFLRHMNRSSVFNFAIELEKFLIERLAELNEEKSKITEGDKLDLEELLELVLEFFNRNGEEFASANHKAPNATKRKIGNVKRLIDLVVGDEETRKKKNVGERYFYDEPAVKERFCDEFIDLTGSVFNEVRGGAEISEFQTKDAGAAGDFKSPRTTVRQQRLCKNESGYSDIRQVVYKQRGIFNAIHKRNQRLIYDVRNLTRNDLAHLSEFFEQWVSEQQQNPCETNMAIVDAWQLILFMFVTGKSDFELFNDFHRSKEQSFIGLKKEAIYLDYQADFQTVSSSLVERLQIILISRHRRLELICGDYFFEKLKKLLILKKTIQKMQGEASDRAIWEPQASIDAAKNIFSQLNRTKGSLISFNKIQFWLAQQIRLASGDDEAMVFLLLNQNQAEQPAQAHYTNYDEQAKSLFQHITSEEWIIKRKPWLSASERGRGEGFGSELVIQFDKLKLLTATLSKRAEVQSTRTFAEVCEKHNTLVDYIYWMLEFSIGFRSVNDPLASLNDIDWQSGVIQLNDKAMRASCSVRYVYLPSLVKQQLETYQNHLKDLIRIQRLHRSPWWKDIDNLLAGEPTTFGFLFYLSKQGMPSRFRPAVIRKRLSASFPAPLNIGRHWLRSRLLEDNCPTPWIDALLGHGEIGTEFASRFSSLSFSQLQRLTKEYLEPLVQKSGWKLVSGLV